jgi:tetratricopeptide (TPR) repeat protein
VADEETAQNKREPEEPADATLENEPQAVDPNTIRDRNKRIRAEAAEKRRRKRDDSPERRRAPARNLDAGEIMDDALARSSHAAWAWLKRNSNRVQWAVVILIVGGIGYRIYTYRAERDRGARTESLVQAIQAEQGRVSEDTSVPAPDPYSGLIDTRPVFPTEEQLEKTAEREYREAIQTMKGPAAGLAELGLAGILYDQGKFEEAKKTYEKVRDSELGKLDRDARARAIEGAGLSLEALGQADPALAAFKQLENSDIPGFGALGMYHQARVLLSKGERDPAKELLKKALEKLKKAAENDKRSASNGPDFLDLQVRELLASIDPGAVPPPAAGGVDLAALQEQLKQAGGGKMDAKKLDEILKQLGGTPGAPKPGAPPAAPASSSAAP